MRKNKPNESLCQVKQQQCQLKARLGTEIKQQVEKKKGARAEPTTKARKAASSSTVLGLLCRFGEASGKFLPSG